MTKPPISPQDEQRQHEAREILERVERGGESVFGGALQKAGARVSDHFAGRDGDRADRVELWAKRIGRALAAMFFVLLIVNLATGWFF
ncbi:MAG: hypothetical protein FJX29_01300 [Alphaproteobacteria bacterium]|nr:hypothetical protein [Alphaproteobacteria bacterium]